ncbi:MAG: pirin family protein [Betaproteobacteria bacterium]
MIEKRAANERGKGEHGWLTSFHSFSFAEYHDPRHMGFGPLRVINEDRVAPGAGFGTHGHRDMEILSYVLDGALAHRDDLGNGSTIRPGDVQRMSAGRGVRHSENNPSPDERVHFLQIWLEPDVRGIDPGYEEAHVPDAAKRGRLALIAGPKGSGAAVTIHQDARVYAALLEGAEAVEHSLAAGRRAYVQVARGSVEANGAPLVAGDAVKLTGEPSVRLAHGQGAEVLVFDLP